MVESAGGGEYQQGDRNERPSDEDSCAQFKVGVAELLQADTNPTGENEQQCRGRDETTSGNATAPGGEKKGSRAAVRTKQGQPNPQQAKEDDGGGRHDAMH